MCNGASVTVRDVITRPEMDEAKSMRPRPRPTLTRPRPKLH